MILATGGSKSGKSDYALFKAEQFKKRAFIATAVAFDNEMENRIQKHVESRSDDYTTYEVPVEITDCINKIQSDYDVIVLDCVTVWLGNLLYHFDNDALQIQLKIDELLGAISRIKKEVIIVTNEVGMGIVPENEMSRKYRDLAGNLNQRLAKIAKEVFFW